VIILNISGYKIANPSGIMKLILPIIKVKLVRNPTLRFSKILLIRNSMIAKCSFEKTIPKINPNDQL
jgi:hypothetical protein